MKIKKAFTLAEILVVMTLIGVIATLTIPTMVKNTQQAQYKTGVKKAYKVLSDFTAEMVSEGKATYTNDAPRLRLSKILSNFIDKTSVLDLSYGNGKSSYIYTDTDSRCVQYEHDGKGKTFGLCNGSKKIELFKNGAFQEYTLEHGFIVTTNDNISYYFITGVNNPCADMAELSTKKTTDDLRDASCATVYVDTNSVFKLPNVTEPQKDIKSGNKINDLTGDRYMLYIASDGVYPGHKNSTIVGKIITDSL